MDGGSSPDDLGCSMGSKTVLGDGEEACRVVRDAHGVHGSHHGRVVAGYLLLCAVLLLHHAVLLFLSLQEVRSPRDPGPD